MSELTHVGSFCPNPDCAEYGKLQTAAQTNIIKFGLTRPAARRYQCTTCKATFTATRGTLFYRRRVPEAEILEALAQIAEGSRISSVSRTTGHKEDTLLAWLREAAKQVSRSKPC